MPWYVKEKQKDRKRMANDTGRKRDREGDVLEAKRKKGKEGE